MRSGGRAARPASGACAMRTRTAVRTFRQIAAAAAAIPVLWAGAALAATAEHGAEQGGLPQLDPSTFPQQLVWLAVSFGVLYWLLSRRLLPRVSEVLEERQQRISEDLEKAQSLRDESQAVTAQYEKAMEDARNDALRVVSEVQAENARLAAQQQAAFLAESAAKVRAAEQRIAEAKAEAMARVREVAAEIAVEAARKVAGVDPDAASASAAVDRALEGRR